MAKDILKYPLGIDDDPFQNSIMFFINEAETAVEEQDADTSGVTLSDLDDEGMSFPGVDPDIEIFDAAAASFERFDKINVNKKAIQLYIPNGIQYTSGFGWNRTELGGLGSIALLAGEMTGEAAGEDLESSLEMLGSEDMSRRVRQEIIDGLVEVAGGVGNMLGVSGGQDAAERYSRRTMNDNQEVLFKNVNGREFSFNFHFLPRNEEEAKSALEIIDMFRIYSHPKISEMTEEEADELAETEGVDVEPEEILEASADTYARWLQYPAQFQPVIMYKDGDGTWRENRTMPRIGQCAVTSTSIEYGPTEFSTFRETISGRGRLPTEIKFSISLMELQVLNRTRITEGRY